MTDLELREAVAVEVMGWDSNHRMNGDRVSWSCGDVVRTGESPDLLPAYETDIACAWQVEVEINRRGLAERYAEVLASEAEAYSITRQVSTGYNDNWGETDWSEVALLIYATPEQRCRAALAAVRGEK